MLCVTAPWNDLQIQLDGHAALRKLELANLVSYSCGRVQLAPLAIHKDANALVRHARYYCRRSTARVFHVPTSRISVACATPTVVAAFTQGNVNAAASPVLTSTT